MPLMMKGEARCGVRWGTYSGMREDMEHLLFLLLLTLLVVMIGRRHDVRGVNCECESENKDDDKEQQSGSADGG